MFFTLYKKAVQESLRKTVFISQMGPPKENFLHLLLAKAYFEVDIAHWMVLRGVLLDFNCPKLEASFVCN